MNEPKIPDSNFCSDDAAFLCKVRVDLDQSCSALDGQTLSRLTRIRHTALALRTQRRRAPTLLPFGGIATAAVLVISVMLYNQSPPNELVPNGTEQLEYIDLLSASEELDFYEELEFYQWLADGSN